MFLKPSERQQAFWPNPAALINSFVISDVETEVVEAVLYLWKRKREKSTASAST